MDNSRELPLQAVAKGSEDSYSTTAAEDQKATRTKLLGILSKHHGGSDNEESDSGECGVGVFISSLEANEEVFMEVQEVEWHFRGGRVEQSLKRNVLVGWLSLVFGNLIPRVCECLHPQG